VVEVRPMNHRRILFALVIVAAGCGGGQKKAAAPDPAAARAAALAEARNAGILGSISASDASAFGSLVGYGDISSGFDDDDVYGGLTGEDYGYGGYGYGYAGVGDSGYGEGGGGTGSYGTIGTGSGGDEGYGMGGYDTRHASSAGTSGIGNGRGHVHEDRVTISVDLASDDYDAHDIVSTLRGHVADLEGCSKTSGTVTVTFTIGTDGTPSHVKADGIGKAAAKCVAHVVGTVAFVPPEGGVPVAATSTFAY
jgi:hypothetical protein